MSNSKKVDIIFYFCLAFAWLQQITALPLSDSLPNNVTTRPKVDLTTDYARQIVRLAKVADIQSNLNTRVDPCVDFYQYSCGNWKHSNPAQLLSNIMTDRFRAIAKAFDHRLSNLLEEPENANALANKVKSFYRACRIVKNDTMYKMSLRNIYKEYGDMPVLVGDGWNGSDFKWWEVIAKIQHKYGKQIILAVDIMGDIKNKSESRLYLGPPNFDVTQGSKLINYLQEVQLIVELQQYLGIEHNVAEKVAKELIKFERELSEGGTSTRTGLTLQDLLSLQTVPELQMKYSESFDVNRYFELVLGGQSPESVYVLDEEYLQNVLEVIESRPPAVVANYIIWHLLKNFFVDMDEDRTTWCLEKTKKHFGKYVDHLVYERYRNAIAEQEVFEVFEDLRTTFRSALRGNKLDWISNSTREYAITKLDAMTLFINSYDNENFTQQYNELQIDPYDYVQNVQQLLMLESRKVLDKLMEVNTSAPEDTEVLAFTLVYNVLENNIRVPVAFLQPRHFWSSDYPHAIKYATLGYLIAHEMIHGFDDEGRNHDKDGNYHKWWDPKSTYEFDERRKCFQAQYHSYSYGGRTLPESVSQSENIADNAGIKLAYGAYKHWVETRKTTDPEIELKEELPGLTLSNYQLFFISFAQVWCEDVQSLFKSTLASADDHAPGMYRVIGSLSNFQEFSWVFQCSKDAPMDPDYKCSIY